jgi:hypothetical protein
MLETEMAVARDAGGNGESFGELLQRDPGKTVLDLLCGNPCLFENLPMLDAIVAQQVAQTRQSKRLDAVLALDPLDWKPIKLRSNK